MRSTIRHELTDAVSAYDDKPREQWLFDFAAQVALCSVQIWWTDDRAGGAVQRPDLVDNRGQHRVRSARGGIRQRAQRVQQETGDSKNQFTPADPTRQNSVVTRRPV